MHDMTISRRHALVATAAGILAGSSLPARGQDTPAAGAGEDFSYEVQRSEAEWQRLLSQEEFDILRVGGTEFPMTSPYWNRNAPGTYHCRGCDLAVYRSEEYAPQNIGFVFFHHAIPNAVLTGIDETDYNGAFPEKVKLSEVHCRRCGSHLGHHFVIKKPDALLHCVNGTALVHRPRAS